MYWLLLAATILIGVIIIVTILRVRRKRQQAEYADWKRERVKARLEALVPGAKFVALSPSLNYLAGTVIRVIDENQIEASVYPSDRTGESKRGPAERGPFPIRCIATVNDRDYHVPL